MKNKSVYIRLIIIYIFIFMIPTAFNIFLLNDISVITQNNVCTNISKDLNSAVEGLEDLLEEKDVIIEKLSGYEDVQYIAMHMNEYNKNRNYSWKKKVADYMYAIKSPLHMEEYYLYFQESSQIISSGKIYYSDEAIESTFQYGEMDWEAWKGILQNEHSRYIFPEARTKVNNNYNNRILYVHSLKKGGGTKGAFIFPIKVELIRNLFNNSNVEKEGWSYIMDKDGRILVAFPSSTGEFVIISEENEEYDRTAARQSIQLNGEKVEVIQAGSGERGLVWVSVLPNNAIAKQIKEARVRNLQMAMLVFSVGIITILAISLHRGRKIEELLSQLFDAGIKTKSLLTRDELTSISEALKSLISNNAEFEKSIYQQKLITKELLLERLLRSDDARIEKRLEGYGIRLAGYQFFVIVFQMSDCQEKADQVSLGEDIVYKQIFRKKMESTIEGTLHMCEIDIDTSAFLCIASKYDMGEGRKRLLNNIEDACKFFLAEYGVSVVVAVGNVCSDIKQISRSYERGWEMLQYGKWERKSVVDCAEYTANKETYYYPMPLEERIIDAVKYSYMESVQELLEQVYSINMIENSINPEMLHFLMNDLQCTALKGLGSLSVSADVEKEDIYRLLEHCSREKDVHLRFRAIKEVFEKICILAQESTTAKSVLPKQKIIDYISLNYANPNFGLAMIAEKFNYTSTYFSKIFKDEFHETFVAYLEDIRIERACELLMTEETIEKIATQVGYNSVHVMRAAFKRKKGIRPNEYRELMKEGREG